MCACVCVSPPTPSSALYKYAHSVSLTFSPASYLLTTTLTMSRESETNSFYTPEEYALLPKFERLCTALSLVEEVDSSLGRLLTDSAACMVPTLPLSRWARIYRHLPQTPRQRSATPF